MVAGLYEQRAAAVASASPDALDAVFTPGSPVLAADRDHVESLRAAGQQVRGFHPQVVSAEATSVSEDRVVLAVVDRWPAYEVVTPGPGGGQDVRAAPGRAESAVRMVLVAAGPGWRIDSATRPG